MYIYCYVYLFQFPLFSEYCDVYIGLGEYVRKTAHGKIIFAISGRFIRTTLIKAKNS